MMVKDLGDFKGEPNKQSGDMAATVERTFGNLPTAM